VTRSENWTSEEWQTAYKKAVEFLDRRELLTIPVSQVFQRYSNVGDLIRLREGKEGIFYFARKERKP